MKTIPKKGLPTYGLTARNGGQYYARYKEDGVQRHHNLGTRRTGEAIKARDKFYESILAEGGTRTTTKIRAAVAEDPDCEAGIYPMHTFKVVVDHHYVGTTTSMEQAKKIRNEYITENEQ